jgi:hypothetical protein
MWHIHNNWSDPRPVREDETARAMSYGYIGSSFPQGACEDWRATRRWHAMAFASQIPHFVRNDSGVGTAHLDVTKSELSYEYHPASSAYAPGSSLAPTGRRYARGAPWRSPCRFLTAFGMTNRE